MTKKSADPKASVILLSGGLDSAANLALCRYEDNPVLALTVRYGQKAQEREVQAARELTRQFDVRLEVVDLPWVGALGGSSLTSSSAVPHLRTDQLDDPSVTRQSAASVWVPNRNGVLINLAAAYAESLGAERVVVGFNVEEAATFPDNSREFMNRATAALALSTANRVEVFSYTADWDKKRIVRELRGLPDPFPFEKLWTCYESGERACGECESCRRLARALS